MDYARTSHKYMLTFEVSVEKSGSIKSECVDMPKVRNVDMKVEFLNAFMGH